jgi:hypothetical protein
VNRQAGKLRGQLDIQYRRASPFPWIPSGWQWVTMAGDKIRTSAKSRVSAFAVHPAVTAAAFTLQFPPGLLVYDHRRTKDTRYVVRDDGTARHVLDDEFFANVPIARLMETDPGEALPHARAAPVRWWIACGLGISIAAIFVLLMFRCASITSIPE